MNYAQYGAVISLNHIDNSHSSSALRTIFCRLGLNWDSQISTQDEGLTTLTAPLFFCYWYSYNNMKQVDPDILLENCLYHAYV